MDFVPGHQQISSNQKIKVTIENYQTYSLTSIILLFLTVTQTLTRHTYLNTNP